MERTYNVKHNDVCRRCLGEGFLVIKGEHQGHGHYFDDKEKVCDLCNGTGMVQVNKEINVSITPKTPKPYAKQ